MDTPQTRLPGPGPLARPDRGICRADLDGSQVRHPVAYLMHPDPDLARGFGSLWRPLGWLPSAAYEALLRRVSVPSLVTGTLRFEDNPERPAGWLITVPHSPGELRAGGRRIRSAIERAVDRAVGLGARTVGLGGLTSPATALGATLRHRSDIGVTSGATFTAAMTFLEIQRLLALCPPDARVALVGAGGSVGRCLALLIAGRTSQPLLLVARNPGRLRGLQARLGAGRAESTADMGQIRGADLVVLLTPARDAALRSEHLGLGAIVLDVAQPRNSRPGLLLARPDVRIVDGGLVSVPGLRRRILPGMPAGSVPAGLAETLLLGLAGHRGHFSLGAPDPSQAEHLLALAARFGSLGFTLATPRSFGEPVCLNRRFEAPTARRREASRREIGPWRPPAY